MRFTLYLIFAINVLMLVALLGVVGHNAALAERVIHLDTKVAKLTAENDRLKRDLTNTRTQLAAADTAAVKAQRYIQDLEQQITEAHSKRQRIEHYLQTKYQINEDKATELAEHFYHARDYASEEHDVEIDVAVLLAMAHTESRFKPTAKSYKGAIGIMQVMPNFWVHRLDFIQTADDLWTPRLNIRAGAVIFAQCKKRWGSTSKAVRCYHGGSGGVTSPKQVTLDYQRIIYDRLNTLGA